MVVLNYQLVRKLGEGGFGSVYLAEQKQLDRKAAIKILHPEFSRNKEVVERFFREAKAMSAIGHDSIIGVQNIGRLDTGEPFYVMEYLDGVALSDHIERIGPLPPGSVLEIFEPIADALGAAHDKGIVHRDLKPQNIVLSEQGGRVRDVKLLDFGIAKLVGDSDAVITRTGFPMGTPMYMAPEQARDSKHVDARADVYSFAATLFHAIAGRPPFVHKNTTDLIVAVQTRPAPPLRLYAPSASSRLEQLIGRCLSKNPDERPASIRQAWSSIRAALEAGDATVGAQTTPPGGRPELFAPTIVGNKRRTAPRAAGKSWLWAMSAAAVITLLATARFATGIDAGATRGATLSPAVVEMDRAIPGERQTISRVHMAAAETVNVLAFVASSEPAPEPRDHTAARRLQAPVTTIDCAPSSFARVCRNPTLSETQIHATLRRLKHCRSRLEPRQYTTIQSLLVSKL